MQLEDKWIKFLRLNKNPLPNADLHKKTKEFTVETHSKRLNCVIKEKTQWRIKTCHQSERVSESESIRWKTEASKASNVMIQTRKSIMS